MTNSEGFRGYEEGVGFHPRDSISEEPSPFEMSPNEFASHIAKMGEEAQGVKSKIRKAKNRA